MLIVNKIYIIGEKGNVEPVAHLEVYNGFAGNRPYHFRDNFPGALIELCDTVTGKTYDIEEFNSESCLNKLQAFRPYGYVSRLYNGFAYDYVIAIDLNSLKFLDYVDTVEHFVFESVQTKEDTKIHMNVIKPPTETCLFESLDESMSLFECEAGVDDETCPCTLFQAIVYFQAGWIGDVVYLLNKDEGSSDDAELFKVTFTNVEAAKRTTMKSTLLKNSPLLKALGPWDFEDNF